MSEINSNEDLDLSELDYVESEFGLVRQMCAQMGNNDSEFSRLDELLKAYKDGHITASEAVTQAKAIQAGKMDR